MAGSGGGIAAWVREKDPGLVALRRSVRAAVVMPSVFALCHYFFSDAQTGLFGAFGAFTILLLADFRGRPQGRLVSYGVLFVAGAAFIAAGTAASSNKVLAVVAMAVVGFAVLFSGIVWPQVASGSTSAILTFVLSVAVVQPVSAIGPRLLGWAIAAALGISACMLLWPPPARDDVRDRLSTTVRAVSSLAASLAAGDQGAEARMAFRTELSLLREELDKRPYPNSGRAADAVAVARLAGRTEWVAEMAALVSRDKAPLGLPHVREMLAAVSENLRLSASLISDESRSRVEDPALLEALKESTRRLAGEIDRELRADISSALASAEAPVPGSGAQGGVGGDAATLDLSRKDLASSLDPTFRSRAFAVAAEMLANAALLAGGTDPVGPRAPLTEPTPSKPVSANGESSNMLSLKALSSNAVSSNALWKLMAHLSLRSVWFRNAVRGAAGLALAVAVAEITNVEHGFWVVLGTLSVLRSNALGIGSTAIRAVLGTAVGVVVGSAVMVAVSDHLVLLWVLLPFAVLVSGFAPSVISFAAGQAAFSVVVIVLFNIIAPLGWRVGLTRVEDVAIGCAVSIVVGMLFWPRGATAALGRALSDAFLANSDYLADAVERLTTTSGKAETAPTERAAYSAHLRLDDAFHQYLAEHGAKVVPVDAVAKLFTGANRIRLAAFTLVSLPPITTDPSVAELQSLGVAGAVLRDSYTLTHRWYEEFAELLADQRDFLDPPPTQDEILQDVLRQAFEEARASRRVDELELALRMLWADHVLETQRQVQDDLLSSAELFARRRHAQVIV